MSLENITRLATSTTARGFSYPVLGNATVYRKARSAATAVDGFSIEFDSNEEARDFLRIMENLSDKSGNRIFPRLANQTNRMTPAAGTTKAKINIEANLTPELEARIRESNLAKSIERQKARKDRAGKAVVATVINAATLGFPVVGYASGLLGRGLAFLERNYLGAIPGLGFALRNSSRLFLDAGAGILEHGLSFAGSSNTRSEARALERISDDVGKAYHSKWNKVFDAIPFGVGVALKAVAWPFNHAVDLVNKAANAIDVRKADEQKSTFGIRRFAANALKAVAFPFRAPEIIASWFLKAGENSFPDGYEKVDRAFKNRKFEHREAQVNNVKPGLIATDISTNDAIKILANQEGLVFDRKYEKDKQTYYLAKLAKFDVNGRAYEVLADYQTRQIFYKCSGAISQDLRIEDVPGVNEQLAEISKKLPTETSKISVNGFNAFNGGEQAIKEMLGAAIDKTKKDNVRNESSLESLDITKSKKFSIKVGSEVLTCDNGAFGFSSHKQNLDMNSREFFNFVSNLSKGKAELTVYDAAGLPGASVAKPKVINLKSGKDPKDKSKPAGGVAFGTE